MKNFPIFTAILLGFEMNPVTGINYFSNKKARTFYNLPFLYNMDHSKPIVIHFEGYESPRRLNQFSISLKYVFGTRFRTDF